jgi:hypothetical protein
VGSGWVGIGRRSTGTIRGRLIIGAIRGMAGTGDIVRRITIHRTQTVRQAIVRQVIVRLRMEPRDIAHRRARGRFLRMRGIVRLRTETVRLPTGAGRQQTGAGRVRCQCSRGRGRGHLAEDISRVRDLHRSREDNRVRLLSQPRNPDPLLGRRTESVDAGGVADGLVFEAGVLASDAVSFASWHLRSAPIG